VAHPSGVVQLVALLQVGPDAEGPLALGVEHDHPRVGVRRRLQESAGQLVGHLARDRVERLRPGQGHRRHVIVQGVGGEAHTGGPRGRRPLNSRSFRRATASRLASSPRSSSGWTTASTTFSEARWRMSMSSSYSRRRSATYEARSSGSEMAWILLKNTALIAGSGPITAIRAVGSASVASGSNPGPAMAYNPAP